MATFTKEERIQQLMDACDSIKDKAADFIGDEEFSMNMTVSIVIESHEIPYLRLERKSYPNIVLKKLM